MTETHAAPVSSWNLPFSLEMFSNIWAPGTQRHCLSPRGCIWELHALSANRHFLHWNSDGPGTTMWPNLSFLTKCLFSFVFHTICLAVFTSQPGVDETASWCQTTLSQEGLILVKLRYRYHLTGIQADGRPGSACKITFDFGYLQFLRSVTLRDICAAATWASSCTYTRHLLQG